jgi:predicted DNA-binding protein (MmcQ/YjbR family)
MSLREKLFAFAKKRYGTAPEYPWMRFPDYAVLRHTDHPKWFGLIMNIPYERLGEDRDGIVDVLNVKLADPILMDLMLQQPGYYPGYHLHKGNWISILLDGTVPFEDVCRALDESYRATASAAKKKEIRPPKDWLVPANPKYYDVDRAFGESDEILWKQSAGIRKGDTVYLYVAAPVTAIRYRCKVTETDLPYSFRDGSLSIRKVMRIRLLRRYPPDRFPFALLGEAFGIYAVRGPRGIPESLKRALEL